MGTKYYSITPVACSRGGTFDAEVQFITEEYVGGEGKRSYISKLLETGFFKRDNAKARAEEEVAKLQALIEQAAAAHLRQYPDSKE